jgi:hypothetical protein
MCVIAALLASAIKRFRTQPAFHLPPPGYFFISTIRAGPAK